MTLDQLRPGSSGLIWKICLDDLLGRRLLTMGIYPGLRVRVVRNAPLRDPMEVEIEGNFFSLRRAEVRLIEVLGE